MPTPTPPLSRALLAADARPEAEVSFGREGKRTRADLHHHVAGLAAHIRRHGGGRWLLHTEDSFAACVGLLALAHAGATAVLPPNRQPETLARLADACGGALLSPAGDAPAGLRVLDPLEPVDAADDALAPLDRDAVVVELFTSGTTGAGTRVAKRVRHLEDEVAVLERCLGGPLGDDARIFATVSHQHIYGLLFRVLWPLASRRPFCADTPLHGQELLPRLLESPAAALVASPVHLRRLAADAQLPLARGVCRAVFSSGGPLDAETAGAIAGALGQAPIEVLGSTETGGVALRRRDGPDRERWRPLPGVRVACDDAPEARLVVASPFVSCGKPGPEGLARFEMGDRVRLADDGSFELLARADRTVKVGAKRLALPEMERALETHAWVDEAALVVAPRAGEPRVHAVAVPSPAGRAALREGSRRDVGAALAEHLAARWDRVLLPRAWRFVDALPRNAQGKLPAPALLALFEAAGGAPRVESERRDGERIERELFVPPDLAGIEGHFEGFPVVPGVMQVGWALDAAARLLGEQPRVRRLEAVKFPALLHPDSRVRLEVELLDARTRLRFSLHCGDEITASGRCHLGEAS